MKQYPLATANALAATTVVIYVVCTAAVVFLPDLSITIAQSWFHGIDLSKSPSVNITVSSFVLGIITVTIGAWLIGFVFAKIYNQFVQ